jgi:hypothetical protein
MFAERASILDTALLASGYWKAIVRKGQQL